MSYIDIYSASYEYHRCTPLLLHSSDGPRNDRKRRPSVHSPWIKYTATAALKTYQYQVPGTARHRSFGTARRYIRTYLVGDNTEKRDGAAVYEYVRTGLSELLLLLGKVGTAHDSDGDALAKRLHELDHVRKDFLCVRFRTFSEETRTQGRKKSKQKRKHGKEQDSSQGTRARMEPYATRIRARSRVANTAQEASSWCLVCRVRFVRVEKNE